MTSVQTSQLPTVDTLRAKARDALQAVGSRVELGDPGAHGVHASTPITGDVLFTVPESTPEQADAAIAEAAQAFTSWRTTPAPVRGALVARLGELLKQHKSDLAALVTIEAGKITSEALGEVQEMIDICEFAVGLSRQLYGRTIASERPGHRLMETWHPLGVVGVITRLQLPRRGVVVERRDRPCLRRHRGLEAVGAHPADRAGLPGAGRAGRRRRRRAACGESSHHGWA